MKREMLTIGLLSLVVSVEGRRSEDLSAPGGLRAADVHSDEFLSYGPVRHDNSSEKSSEPVSNIGPSTSAGESLPGSFRSWSSSNQSSSRASNLNSFANANTSIQDRTGSSGTRLHKLPETGSLPALFLGVRDYQISFREDQSTLETFFRASPPHLRPDILANLIQR